MHIGRRGRPAEGDQKTCQTKGGRPAEGQNIMKAFLRFFLSPSGGSGQNDKKGRLGQNDEEGFPLEKYQVFALPDGLTETRKRHKQI